MAARIIDMAGKKYGALTGVRCVGPHPKNRDMMWLFECSCGANITAHGNEVRRGGVISCSSCAKDKRRQATSTHGESNSSEYAAWEAMKRRCNNPNSFGFEHYGGRGISVCNEWIDSFVSFLEDMGRKPSEKHTLDRTDCNGNYNKRNCRWATREEQANNKRNNRIITIGRESRTLSQWAKSTGLSESCIRGRMRRGKSGRELIAPAGTTRSNRSVTAFTYQGEKPCM